MLISAADLAYMKGEAAAQPRDHATAQCALTKAADYGYLVPDARRDAFVQGFRHTLRGPSQASGNTYGG
jgi:hypothetical protein